MPKKPLMLVLACLFVVMIGYGITLPVLPFYTERLAMAEGSSSDSAAIHVGLLTAIYPLMQLVFAPLWGRWSDRAGRKPLLLIGMGGFAVAQALFGVSTSLAALYGARIVGGILSSATIPTVTAYVTDMTSESNRSRGMAWQGTAVSLGVVVGPALGGVLSRGDLHLDFGFQHFRADSFSTPFFAASALALLALLAAVRVLPESLPIKAADGGTEVLDFQWRGVVRTLAPLLGLALAAQFGLAMFESTFALHARRMLDYGPSEVGAAFMVCGLVMAVLQAGVVGFLGGGGNGTRQIAAGFSIMGVALFLFVFLRGLPFVLAAVGWLALGMALVAPNVAALVSRGGGHNTGAVMGILNAANSVGQVGGPALGGFMFAWGMPLAYTLTGALMLAIGLMLAWRARAGDRWLRLTMNAATRKTAIESSRRIDERRVTT